VGFKEEVKTKIERNLLEKTMKALAEKQGIFLS
jgi:hypothetical protein